MNLFLLVIVLALTGIILFLFSLFCDVEVKNILSAICLTFIASSLSMVTVILVLNILLKQQIGGV